MSEIKISQQVKVYGSRVSYLLIVAMLLAGLWTYLATQEKNESVAQIDGIRRQVLDLTESQLTLEQRAILEFAVRDMAWYADDVKKSVIMCNSMNLHNITGNITAFDATCTRWFSGGIPKAQCECVTPNETVR